ncbi:Crp/Fnr family transcriptional regulator [Lacinutrix undariae]
MNQIENYSNFIKATFDRYHTIDKNSMTHLLSIAKATNLQKGKLLLDIGQTSKNIYILYQGAIVSYFINTDGNQYHKNIFIEGNFVGSTVSNLKSEPSQFALEVIENTTVISFNYKKYKALINTYPNLKDFYVAYLEKNWVIDKEQREINIVMKEASERYLSFITAHPNIENRVPLNYIASHLGITPTQLSRIRKKIKDNRHNQHM